MDSRELMQSIKMVELIRAASESLLFTALLWIIKQIHILVQRADLVTELRIVSKFLANAFIT